MKKVLNLLSIAFAVVLLSSALSAAEPQTKEGSKSIFYGFNGLSELSVDNSYFGAQYLFADKMGFWAELNLSMVNDKEPGDDDGISTTGFGLSVGFIYYMFQKGPVAIFISPQVTFLTNSIEDKDSQLTNKDTQNDLGIGFAIGGEWWFTDNLSLSVSTAFGFHSRTIKAENGSTEDEQTHTCIGIIPEASSKFVLSFYF